MAFSAIGASVIAKLAMDSLNGIQILAEASLTDARKFSGVLSYLVATALKGLSR